MIASRWRRWSASWLGCGRGSIVAMWPRRGWWPRCRRFRRSRWPMPRRTGLREAGQTMRRAETVDQVPEFGASLDAGRLSGAHVDVLTRALGRLEPDQRGGLIGQASSLVLIAEHATPDEFARTVRNEIRRLEQPRRRCRAVGASEAGDPLHVVHRQRHRDGTVERDLGPGDDGSLGDPARSPVAGDVPRPPTRRLPERSDGETVVPASPGAARPVGRQVAASRASRK